MMILLRVVPVNINVFNSYFFPSCWNYVLIEPTEKKPFINSYLSSRYDPAIFK